MLRATKHRPLRRTTWILSALAAVAAVVISACGGSTPTPPATTPAPVELTTQQIAQRAKYGIAFIKSKDAYGSGYGTGVVVDADREKVRILTAAHVVGQAMRVSIAGGSPASARLVGRADCRADLALIEIPRPARVTVIPLRARPVQVGERVVAMGFSGTSLRDFTPDEPRVTEGKVSRADVRNLSMGKSDVRTAQAIQTDASINPGDSGGPVVDPSGRLVGISVFKDTGPGMDNAGYALPAAVVREELPKLRQGDRSQPGWKLMAVDSEFPYARALAIFYPEYDPRARRLVARYLRAMHLRGMLITGHEEGQPSARLPLLALIQSINGTGIRSMTNACDVWESQPEGGTVRVTGLRLFSAPFGGGIVAPFERRIHIPR
jgi:S1-C subfamily serine protease